MPDELETVLRLVAEGHLSPEEAAPIIEALGRGDEERSRSGPSLRDRADALGGSLRGRQLRIRVTERGRQVVNLRIPLAFADTALHMVPGIGEEQSQRIREALDSGSIGPIIDVDDDGDGVLISIE